jgi:hypothetical protein
MQNIAYLIVSLGAIALVLLLVFGPLILPSIPDAKIPFVRNKKPPT